LVAGYCDTSSSCEVAGHFAKKISSFERAAIYELGLVFLDLRCNSRFDFSVDYGRGSKEKGHQSALGAIGMVPRYLCSPVDGV